MGKKKPQFPPIQHEPPPQVEAPPPEESPQEAAVETGRVNKSASIREAINALGGAMAVDKNGPVIDWIKNKYNVTVTSNEVSQMKTKMRKKMEPTSASQSGVIRTLTNAAAAGLTARDIVTLKTLIDRCGKDDLKELVDVL